MTTIKNILLKYITLTSICLFLTACGTQSTVDVSDESTNLGLQAFEMYKALDESLKCGELSQDHNQVGVGWYSIRRAIGDGFPSRAIGDGFPALQAIGDGFPSRAIGDGFPSRLAARRAIGDGFPSRAIGDGFPSRRAIGDGFPSRAIGDGFPSIYDSSVMMVEESGEVKYQEEIDCANYVIDMEILVASGADSVLVSTGDKTVSVNVENGMAKINIAFEDIKSTEIQVQDTISGDTLVTLFEGE